MFELGRLFKRADTVQRHLAAPLARSRLAYLGHRAEEGAKPSTLRGIAALQTMCRLGLLRRAASSATRSYTSEGCTWRLKSLGREIGDVATLEQRMARNEWAAVADVVLRGDETCRPQMGETEVVDLLLASYARVARTGALQCSVSTLVDTLGIVLLSKGFRVKGYKEALTALATLQGEHPKDVRFHVDRRGRPVFVKISRRLLP